jgi:hypothetical protein
MSEQPATQALGSTTVVFGWVEETQVQQVLHASDGFQLMLGICVAGFGGAAAGVVALAAGALHPIALYLILCVFGTATLLAGAFAGREFARYRKVRAQLAAATAKVPVPVLLVTPGQPSFSVGGYGVAASTQVFQGLPVQQGSTRGPGAESATEGSLAPEGNDEGDSDQEGTGQPVGDT